MSAVDDLSHSIFCLGKLEVVELEQNYKLGLEPVGLSLFNTHVAVSIVSVLLWMNRISAFP